MQRNGVLMGRFESDTEAGARMAAFREQFQKRGRVGGPNRPIRCSLAGARE